MVYFFIFWYAFVVLIFYVVVVQRMKFLSQRHAENTKLESLGRGYKKVQRRLIVLLLILVTMIAFLFLIFANYEILWERWLYVDTPTLDRNVT